MAGVLYDAVYLIPFCLIPVLWSNKYYETGFSPFTAGMLTILAVLFCLTVVHIKSKGRMMVSAVLGSAIAACAVICPSDILFSFLSENVHVFLLLAGVVVCFFLGKIMTGFRASRLFAAIMLSVSLIISMIVKLPPDKTAVSLVLLFVLCCLTEEVRYSVNKSQSADHKRYLVFLSPFYLLFFILVLVFPVSDEPYGWGFVKSIRDAALEGFDRISDLFSFGSPYGYGDAFAGFSENSGVGRDLRENDKKLMEAEFSRSSAPVVYITGKTFDTFNGREWEKTFENDGKDAFLDSLETGYALSRYFGNSFYDYFKRTSIDLRFMNMKSGHVFTPGKIASISSDGKSVPIVFEGGDILFEEQKGYNNEYRIQYYRLNRDHPDFLDFLRGAHDEDPTLWPEMLKRYELNGSEGVSYEDLLSYRKRIKEIYLKETPVSDRLGRFMEELMKGASDDAEKLERIEKLLASMKYNAAPGDLPEEIDTPSEFLDYLIFDKQEGYCVYYTTAFVLLARSQGIPSRYVQGFRVSSKKGKAFITGNNSHSWPECYIDGVGFIPYEPTPGFKTADSFKTSGEIRPQESSETSVSDDADRIPEITENKEEEQEELIVEWKYIAVPLAFAAGAAILLFAADRFLKRLWYRRLTKDKRIRTMFKRNMFILRILGYNISEGETLEEYTDRLRKSVADEYLAFIGAYEAFIYGNKPDVTEILFERNNSELSALARSYGLKYRILLWVGRW
ncbi:MAG: transglutaminase-like domain-containing protein [Lachnospiraceae bacterium]|nr:transglutaminase-like domain-containing protein [Lachnospiraceae bacterium]